VVHVVVNVSVRPNLELYNHVRKTASPAIANRAVGDHRAGRALFLPARATADTIVGERAWATRGSTTTRDHAASSIAS
jgi:hypothetical protein